MKNIKYIYAFCGVLLLLVFAMSLYHQKSIKPVYSGKELIFYMREDGFISTEMSSSNDLQYVYKCLTNECKNITEENFQKYALIHDGDYIIYEVGTDNIKKLVTENNISVATVRSYEDNYYFLLVFDENKSFYTTEPSSMYYINEDEYVFQNENIALNKYLDYSEIAVLTFINDDDFIFYSLKSAKYLGKFSVKNSYYIRGENVVSVNPDTNENVIYSNTFKPLPVESNSDIVGFTSDNNLIISKSYAYRAASNQEMYSGYGSDRGFKIYNQSGELIKESKKYKSFQVMLSNEYFLAVDNDNYLKLYDIEENELAKLTLWNEKQVIRRIELNDNAISVYTGKNGEKSVFYKYDIHTKDLTKTQLDYIINDK